MSCSTEKLYHLTFVVKTVTRCCRAEDTECGVVVCVQFLDLPECDVCDIPTVAANGCDSVTTATVTSVDRGVKITFPRQGPEPVPVAIHMYRLMGPDVLPGRQAIASGRLDVLPAAGCEPDVGCCDEQTVPMTDCQSGRTVAVLSVVARAWIAGPLTVSAVDSSAPCRPTSPPPPCQTPCPPPCPPPCQTPCPQPCLPPCQPSCPPPCETPCQPPPPPPSSCQSECPRRKPKACCPRDPTTPSRSCRRTCDKCSCGGRRRRSSSAAAAVPEPHRQYTTIGCEIDGRKIDLRVRKRNYETCAVQRKIANEAQQFASRVMSVVHEMHGLISDSVVAKMAN